MSLWMSLMLFSLTTTMRGMRLATRPCIFTKEYQRLMLANLLAALPNPTRASKSGLSDLLKDLKSHLNLVDADSLGLLPSDPSIQTILESQLDRFVAGFELFATQVNQLYFQQPDLPQQMVAMEPVPEPVETDHLEPAGA